LSISALPSNLLSAAELLDACENDAAGWIAGALSSTASR
jgi:hypothetical protein